MATPTQQSGSVVVGYFATGHAAHRAINALIEGGFQPSAIGAAFHSGTGAETPAERPDVGSSLRGDLGTTSPASAVGSDTAFGAPASDSTAAQPNMLGAGAGTPFSGAGKPGPIPGSSLAHTGLPTNLKQEMPSSNDVGTETDSGGWSGRLRHVFSSRDDQTEGASAPAPVTKESQNFGTGEGHLNLNSAPMRPYSQPAFERSFTGYGVEPGHARSVSHRIGRGGAVVSVHAAGRSAEAERILETHGGEVRMAAGGEDPTAAGTGQVEIFGTLDRGYAL